MGLLLALFGVFAGLALITFLTRQTVTEERGFAADAVSAVDVDVDVGNVTIVEEVRADVGLTMRIGSALLSKPDPTAELDGGTLVLRSDCPFFLAFSCRVDFALAVPTGSALAVEVHSTAGNTDLTDIGGVIVVHTSAGNITVTDFRGTEATLSLSAGNIAFSSLEPPSQLQASTSAGNVEIVVPDEVYRVEAETSAGDSDVEVRQDPESTLVIEARTSAGNITIDRR